MQLKYHLVFCDQESKVQFLEYNAIACYTSITKGCKQVSISVSMPTA